MNTREPLRQQMRVQREQLSFVQQQLAAEQLAVRLEQQPIFQLAQSIAFYIAHGGEMNPDPLLKIAAEKNKKIYLPILDSKEKNKLYFISYKLGDELKPNRYNIPEPVFDPAKLISTEQLDLIFLPLVAFDAHGNRLGMGAGYYDRTLNFKLNTPRVEKPHLIGLAYDFQRITFIAPEKWDVPLDSVATESGFYEAV